MHDWCDLIFIVSQPICMSCVSILVSTDRYAATRSLCEQAQHRFTLKRFQLYAFGKFDSFGNRPNERGKTLRVPHFRCRRSVRLLVFLCRNPCVISLLFRHSD
jgi:hypothetical protein